MIGLDTNILVRLFVHEPGPDQEKAHAFFTETAGRDIFFVCDIVLVEFAWTLRARYGYTRDDVSNALHSLLTNDDIRFESAATIRDAVGISRRTGADFSDALIASAGREAGCRTTMTLDRKAARRVPHMEALV